MTTLMRNGRDRRSENPSLGHARKERVSLFGTDQRITSGPVARRPHSKAEYMTAPERFADSQIPLAPRAPSIQDPTATLVEPKSCSAAGSARGRATSYLVELRVLARRSSRRRSTENSLAVYGPGRLPGVHSAAGMSGPFAAFLHLRGDRARNPVRSRKPTRARRSAIALLGNLWKVSGRAHSGLPSAPEFTWPSSLR